MTKRDEAISLVRASAPSQTLPGLERIGEQIALGIRAMLERNGATGAMVTSSQSETKGFGAWRDGIAEFGAFAQYRLPPIKGGALMFVPGSLIAQLVDRFYGGNGDVQSERGSFSTAETRFASRIAGECSQLFTAAWASIFPIDPALLGIKCDPRLLRFVGDDEIMAIQSFSVSGGLLQPVAISLAYPLAALRGVPCLSDEPEIGQDNDEDPLWQSRLTEAVLQARLPLRTIFARPELPLSRLLSLQPGDIIPICLPSTVPVTVGGRLFAQATVGDSSGRAAIQIEKIEEGNKTDD